MLPGGLSTIFFTSSMSELSEPVDVALWTSAREAMMYSWSHAQLVPDSNHETSSFSAEIRAPDKLA